MGGATRWKHATKTPWFPAPAGYRPTHRDCFGLQLRSLWLIEEAGSPYVRRAYDYGHL